MYTLATITNSIIYLAKGTFEDPSGNWHELDRAVLVGIAVVVYVPTLLLTFFYVFVTIVVFIVTVVKRKKAARA